MCVAEMSSDRNAVIDELNHCSCGLWWQREVQFHGINSGVEQVADLLRHGLWRGDVVEHVSEGRILEAAVRAIE